MAKGPSKLLYAAGGWFLGGIVGSLVGAAIILAVGLIAGPAAIPVLEVAGAIATFAGSVIGAVKGWSHAKAGQAEFAEIQRRSVQTREVSLAPEQEPALTQNPQRFTDAIPSRQTNGLHVDALANEAYARDAQAAR